MKDFNINAHIDEINKNGYTIVRNCFPNMLADVIVKEFDEWCKDSNNLFTLNTKKRVCNFHTYSENTLDLVTNENVNKIVSTFFNKQQVVYTSLTFREGTEQDFHIDTPHFYTNPINKYCGVWYALEDIDQKAGPLKYYKKSHKIDYINNHEIYNKLYDYKKTYNQNNFNCMVHFNKLIENQCKKLNLELFNETNYENINKGDVVIWHPNLLHGGSIVIDETLTRYSLVSHNIPINTQVFNASHFFTESPSNEYLNNKCIYDYLYHKDIPYVNHKSKPACQISYL